MIVALFAVGFFASTACNCGEDVTGNDKDGVHDAGADAVSDTGDELDAVDDEDAENGDDAAHDEDADPPQDADPDEPWDDDECPMYEIECDGECIPGATDPDNCGGCGITCGENEVCSGGHCIDETDCPEGEDYSMDACDRTCVDTRWDDENCGGCGNTCSDGTGCSFGSCVDVVDFDEPEKCEDGGPPILFGEDVDDADLCAGELASTTFRWGLCSCEWIHFQHDVYVDGFDSAVGPYIPGGYGGGVGANLDIYSDNNLDITGTLWSAGEDPLGLRHDSTVGDTLHAGGDLAAERELYVARDGYVVGDITGLMTGGAAGDPVEFGETLYLNPDSDYDPDRVSYADSVVAEHEVGPACTECDPDDRIDIEAIVEARSDDNDNDEIGLEPDFLDTGGAGSATRVDLPCGHYYLNDVDVNERVTIIAHGNTALYIDGDVRFGSEVVIAPATGAELDIFVTGDVTFEHRGFLGSANYPALMRMYVGGDDGVTATIQRMELAGYIYAVPGGLDFGHRMRVFGGMYTQDFDTAHRTNIHFDRRVLTVGQDCPEDDDDDDDDNGDDDDDTPGDLCVPEGGSCDSTADCCTPLECHEGICQIAGECSEIGEPCVDIEDCCDGLVCVEEECSVIP